MKKDVMLKALEKLDGYLKKPVQIVIGGGAAMLLAHDIPLSTMDIDGLLVGTEVLPAEIDALVKKIAGELKINPHWFNSYFDTFTYTVPPDYRERLITVYKGNHLKVSAFGAEDLLIMKCFSGREKDIGHAKALMKKLKDLLPVETCIEKFIEKGLPNAETAMEFFEDIKDQTGR